MKSLHAPSFMKYYFLSQLKNIELGSVLGQLRASFNIAFLLSPFGFLLHLFDVFVFTDRAFVAILGVCLFGDLAAGVFKHIKFGTFRLKRMFLGFLEKCFISFLAMVLFNAMGSIKEFQANPTALDAFNLFAKLLNTVYVAGSAFSSIYVITGGKFPPESWMNRIRKFNKSGSVEDLTGKPATVETKENEKQ